MRKPSGLGTPDMLLSSPLTRFGSQDSLFYQRQREGAKQERRYNEDSPSGALSGTAFADMARLQFHTKSVLSKSEWEFATIARGKQCLIVLHTLLISKSTYFISSLMSILRQSEDDVISTGREATKEQLQQPSEQRTSAVDASATRRRSVPFVDQQSAPPSSTEKVAHLNIIRRTTSACKLCGSCTPKLLRHFVRPSADARALASRLRHGKFKLAQYLSKHIRSYRQKRPQIGQLVCLCTYDRLV